MSLRYDWSYFRKISGPKNFYVQALEQGRSFQKVMGIPLNFSRIYRLFISHPRMANSFCEIQQNDALISNNRGLSTTPPLQFQNLLLGCPKWGQEIISVTIRNIGKRAALWKQNVPRASSLVLRSASWMMMASFLGSFSL